MTGSSALHAPAMQADQPSVHLTSPALNAGLLSLRLLRVRLRRQAIGGRAVLRIAYPFHLAGPR